MSSPTRRCPAHDAAFEGKLSVLASLVAKNPKCLSERDAEGRTPLHLAAQVRKYFPIAS